MSDLDDPVLRARLPLISEGDPWMPDAVAEGIQQRDPQCTRCDLHRAAGYSVCMGPKEEGPAGAPLVVLETPSEKDAALGGFSTGLKGNEILHKVLRKYGSFRICWAVSCPAGRDPTPAQVAACRPFLAGEFDRKPPRALVLGSVAAEGVTGFPFRAHQTRRAWAYVKGVPTFFVLPQGMAAHNAHHRKWLEEDIHWALTTPDPAQLEGEVRVLLTPEEAREYLKDLDNDKPLSLDTEYHPKEIWAKGDFTVLCMSFAQDVGHPVVIPGPVLYKVRPELKVKMESLRLAKVAQDAKNERAVLWRAFGIDLRGVEWDTLRVAGLIESEAPKGLGPMSWLVGMGGYKDAGQVGAKDEDDE